MYKLRREGKSGKIIFDELIVKSFAISRYKRSMLGCLAVGIHYRIMLAVNNPARGKN